MKVKSTSIEDVLLVTPEIFEDSRGYFFESFNENEFSSIIGRSFLCVQDNQSFSSLGTQKGTSIAIVAPAISEALVATAGGILVATFAYTFHLILKRKSYELSVLLESQADLILSQKA
jgi:dTDP-4-dehydrorhamnose 3,5-epimerase-like enzyme